ncbi:MAG: peptidylprolyl isomerase [Chloroflexota bacterium]
MSFRNRPVLDRKHRPRWQDELRTQRLIVAGFAVAIAVAIGIFAATAWSDHYQSHLRPVASVGDTSYNVDDLSARADMIASELQARYLDLQDELGGVRDPLIQQGQQGIQSALNAVASTAADSLVMGRVLGDRAAQYGITITDAAVSAEVRRRQSLKERLKLSLITVAALPADAKAGAKATDADWARAKGEIDDILAQLNGGADFATTAKAKSSDSSAASGGLLGWVMADDLTYATFFTEAHAAAKNTLVGPIKDATGYHILRLEDREAAGPNTRLKDLLSSAGVNDAGYRSYVRGELLRTAFNTYFSTKVMSTYQPQREVAQIFIAALTTPAVPQERIRHYLAQPIPGGADQSTATAAQWATALARANAFRAEALKPDADWFSIAATSDDTGSGSRGGDLGWSDPASSQYVPEFKAAVAKLKVGEISQPVKTQFGYHIIEITGKRDTPGVQGQQLVDTLRQHPDQFARLAREQSEDATTAAKGGALGWVIRYQLEAKQTDAIFAMTKPDQISDLVPTSTGFYIFKLIDSSPARLVPTTQLDQVRQTGFNRWLTEIRGKVGTWVDGQYAAAGTTP